MRVQTSKDSVRICGDQQEHWQIHGFARLYANLRYSEIICMTHGHCMPTSLNANFERTQALVDGLHARWPRFCCSAAGELLQLHNQHLPSHDWLNSWNVLQQLDSQSMPGMPHGKCLAPGRAWVEKLLANLVCKSSIVQTICELPVLLVFLLFFSRILLLVAANAAAGCSWLSLLCRRLLCVTGMVSPGQKCFEQGISPGK